MQYLNYALQTSTRLLTSQSHSQSQNQSQSQSSQHQAAATLAATPFEEQIAHACCSRGAQLLRLRQQELAKRRALELEDQLNANVGSADSDACSEELAEGAVGGQQEQREQEEYSSQSAPHPVQ
ncbi:GH22134 [Drosophila grimshawi]|uniref:GH22134 n=1 Tax=Drosophila grimshawi TaxID=7222 RepID=B4J4K7_DROGR|nr:GH22134 [Drosophila grimshawi]